MAARTIPAGSAARPDLARRKTPWPRPVRWEIDGILAPLVLLPVPLFAAPGLRGHRAAGAGRKEARRAATVPLADFLQKSWRALGFAPQLKCSVMERTH